MPKIENDDDFVRISSEGNELAREIAMMRESRAEKELALTNLDEKHWEILCRIHEFAEQLRSASEVLGMLTTERKCLTQELLNFGSKIEKAVKHLRSLKTKAQDYVGRDVCPLCGSKDIAPVFYGNFKLDPEWDEPFVNGGCTWNFEKTACCLDCGKRFLGNLDKWVNSRIKLSAPSNSA